MSLLNDRNLIAMIGVSSVIIFLIATAFIMAVSVDGYCITPSPVISTNSVYISEFENVTVFGQSFTPDGTAILYGAPENHTANVDKNGNTSWTYYQTPAGPYTIYALDGNFPGRKSNIITLVPTLHDATLQPSYEPTATLAPTPAPFVGVEGIGAIMIGVGLYAQIVRKRK